MAVAGKHQRYSPLLAALADEIDAAPETSGYFLGVVRFDVVAIGAKIGKPRACAREKCCDTRHEPRQRCARERIDSLDGWQ